eukprot:GHVO01027148.1.p1 GENE.GHVO01027148.1~~GHVO01027148.1.p1  ORF type:complete len:132 (+),score=21.45 GHVO01027148.1:417-812(+)
MHPQQTMISAPPPPQPQTIPAPLPTLFCNNLNDRISRPDLLESLYEFFLPCGDILEVHAGGRGHAFVCFAEVTSAVSAIRVLQGKRFLGKEIRIQFAKRKSDATAIRDGTFKPHPPKKRLKEQKPTEEMQD